MFDLNGPKDVPETKGSTPIESKKSKRVKSPIKMYGEKTNLAKKLISFFPPHEVYCELFGGSGSVLLAKAPSKIEVLNDLNEEFINLYAVIKEDKKREELEKLLSLTLYHETEHKRAKYRSKTLGSVERARRFYCSNQMSFNGKIDGSFSTSKKSNVVPSFYNGIKKFAPAARRFANVTFLNRDFERVVKGFDREETFFFADPPYVHSTRKSKCDYTYEMTDADHERMLEVFKAVKGKVMLCGYHSDLYAKHLQGWNVREFPVKMAGTAHTGSLANRIEVIWMNYVPPKNNNKSK